MRSGVIPKPQFDLSGSFLDSLGISLGGFLGDSLGSSTALPGAPRASPSFPVAPGDPWGALGSLGGGAIKQRL